MYNKTKIGKCPPNFVIRRILVVIATVEARLGVRGWGGPEWMVREIITSRVGSSFKKSGWEVRKDGTFSRGLESKVVFFFNEWEGDEQAYSLRGTCPCKRKSRSFKRKDGCRVWSWHVELGGPWTKGSTASSETRGKDDDGCEFL